MIEYVVANKEMVCLSGIGVVIAIFGIVKYVQHVGLEAIRKQVYHLFIEAEREFQYGENTEKFEWVIQWSRMAIPTPFNLFITEKLLRKVVQAWFDLCKDLLDDGKLNNIVNKETEVE